jgi:hypothetical protein
MENHTFIIKYDIILIDGSVIKDKEMKVKNCFNSLVAQCKLEKYLQKKHEDFKKLIVHSCSEDYLSTFGNIFGDSGNPFGNLFAGGDPWSRK